MQPSEGDIAEIAESLGLNPDDTQIAHFLRYTAGFLGAHEAVLGVPAGSAEVAERAWRLPDENALGAWYVRTDLEGVPGGPLEGQRAAIKGNDPLPNTMPFDHTHHPAMSVPCGVREGLPVGMMLVGRAFEESLIYRAAYAFEQDADWRMQ